MSENEDPRIQDKPGPAADIAEARAKKLAQEANQKIPRPFPPPAPVRPPFPQQAFLMHDVNGKIVTVAAESLLESMQRHGMALFGLTLPTIVELRKVYLMVGGEMPASPQSVAAVFTRLFNPLAGEQEPGPGGVEGEGEPSN